MIRAALLLSALMHAHAHIYERCELARELTGLGVHRDHLATWVCIAYHESRFDTSARNYGSGDHGLFQISELYWCGPGKACGVPCTAFRDEDISDDLQCALRIHREHTVLQGDGYMAWVVYPYHCKNINRKKYLADCEASLKNVTVDPDRARGQKSLSTTTPKPFDAEFYAKNLPSFLAINSIFENNNQVNQFEGDDEKIDWVNFKFDNIDNIKLPKVSKETIIDLVRPAYTTTSTTESYEENYPKPNYKNDWVNYKFDNIDNLKLPAKSSANQNNDLPSWLNIKIDSSVDDLKLPAVVNNAVKHVPVTTTPGYTNYDENIPRQKYKNDWFNLRIDNIDDLQLPVLPKTEGSRRNNEFNWLNIKIDTKIDDIDLDKLAEKINVEKVVPVQITTSTVRTTTIDPELIGIKPPMPRKIESNQFRRRMMNLMNAMMTLHNIAKEESPDKVVTESSSISNRIPIEVSTTRPKPGRYPVYTEIRRNKQVTESPSTTSSVFSFRWNSPRSEATTQKTITQQSTILKDNSQHENVNSATEKNIFKELETVTKTTTTTKESPLFEYRFNDGVSEIINKPKPKEDDISVNRLPSYSQEPLKTTTTTAKPPFTYSSTTLKPETTSSSGGRFSFGWNKQSQSGFTFKPFTFSTAKSTTFTTTSRPETSSTFRAYSTKELEETKNVTQTALPSTTTTVRPWSWNSPRWTLASLNTHKTSVTNSSSTESRVSSTTRPEIKRQRWSFSSFGTDFNRQTKSSQPAIVQTTTTTSKPTVTRTTSKPEETYVTSRIVSSQNVTPKPSEASPKVIFTFKPFTTTVKPDTSREFQKGESKTSVAPDTATRTTPSIFDLYLRPEKFSTVRQYQFPTFKPSGNKLTIFSGGTTPRPAAYVKP